MKELKYLNEIRKLMWKRKYFRLLSLVLIISIGVVIKYCESPLLLSESSLSRWLFVKQESADMLPYNLCTSYIVTFMFFFIQILVPECVEEIKKRNEILPFRIAIQREVEQFVSNIIDLWTSIGRATSNKGIFVISDLETIGDFFNLNIIELSSKGIKLKEKADYVGISNYNFHWLAKTRIELERICTLGNLILTRYKGDIPPQIFYDMFYILNESSMVGNLLKMLEEIASLRNGNNFPLSDCINFTDEKGKTNINKTCESIINLYNWVNSEYNDLVEVKGINVNINSINFRSYIEKETIVL